MGVGFGSIIEHHLEHSWANLVSSISPTHLNSLFFNLSAVHLCCCFNCNWTEEKSNSGDGEAWNSTEEKWCSCFRGGEQEAAILPATSCAQLSIFYSTSLVCLWGRRPLFPPLKWNQNKSFCKAQENSGVWEIHSTPDQTEANFLHFFLEAEIWAQLITVIGCVLIPTPPATPETTTPVPMRSWHREGKGWMYACRLSWCLYLQPLLMFLQCTEPALSRSIPGAKRGQELSFQTNCAKVCTSCQIKGSAMKHETVTDHKMTDGTLPVSVHVRFLIQESNYKWLREMPFNFKIRS